MTTATTSSGPAQASASRRWGSKLAHYALVAANLIALSLFGTVALAILCAFFVTGLATIPALGFGFLVLLATAYGLLGLARIEAARAGGLHGLTTTDIRFRTTTRTGLAGFAHGVWLQVTDGPSWRMIAHLAVATVLGWIALGAVGMGANGLGLIFAPQGAQSQTAMIAGTGLRVDIVAAVPVGIGLLVASVVIIVIAAVLAELLASNMLQTSRAQLAADAARSRHEAEQSHHQREGAMRAADVERTRIERDLHDGVQPRLVSVGMTLGMARQKLDTDPQAARELIDEAHTSTKAAITELRQLARGIHASVLDDRGLDAAISALAARSPVPVQMDIRLSRRCSRHAETAMYFALAETITNAAKHSHAQGCRIVVRERDDVDSGPVLWARVEDNGIGGARIISGGGLDGVVNRAVAAGGSARVDSPHGGPTTVEVIVPCAS